MKLNCLREPYHKLPNMMSGITLAMGGFSVIYTEDPGSINTATKDELNGHVKRMQEYYEGALKSLETISAIFNIIGAPALAEDLKTVMGGHLKDISDLIDKTKSLHSKISDNHIKDDIINIIKEMQPFQSACEAIAEIISEDVEKLKSYGIYFKLYNDKGEIVPKILFADYEKEVNKSLKSFFDERGYVTFTVADSDDIMDAIRKERPDLVYLDIKPPSGKSGFDILKEIKTMDSKIKVLMVSVFDEKEIEEKLKENNVTADACIKKPYNLEVLESLINKLAPLGERVKI